MLPISSSVQGAMVDAWTKTDIAIASIQSILILVIIYLQFRLDRWSKKPAPYVEKARGHADGEDNEIVFTLENLGGGYAKGVSLIADVDVLEYEEDSVTRFRPRPTGLDLIYRDIKDSEWFAGEETSLPPNMGAREYVCQVAIDLKGDGKLMPFNAVLEELQGNVTAVRLTLKLQYSQFWSLRDRKVEALDYVIFPDEAETLDKALAKGTRYSKYLASREGARLDAIDPR